MSHGMEHWHPNPDFFFLPGAGPMLDIGPYYITDLINLIGPVRRVAALDRLGHARPAPSSPRARARARRSRSRRPTNIHALLEFAVRRHVTLGASWDVWAHRHRNIELYGTEGALFVPDPNWFGGTVELARAATARSPRSTPVGPPVRRRRTTAARAAAYANYRTAGLADMAVGILDGRDAALLARARAARRRRDDRRS